MPYSVSDVGGLAVAFNPSDQREVQRALDRLDRDLFLDKELSPFGPYGPYVYWVVFDIGPGTSAMLEGKLPPGARQARGTAGYDKYDAPCPGSGGHGYRFTVYALNTVLNLPNGTSLQSAWRAIAAATIGRGRLPVSASS